jgi:hypothetical protein
MPHPSYFALTQQPGIPQLPQPCWRVVLLEEGRQVRPHLLLCIVAHDDVKVTVVRLLAEGRADSDVLLGTLQKETAPCKIL